MDAYTTQDDNQPDINRLFEDLTDEDAWYRTDALICRVIDAINAPYMNQVIVEALNKINIELRKIEKAESEINSIIDGLREE